MEGKNELKLMKLLKREIFNPIGFEKYYFTSCFCVSDCISMIPVFVAAPNPAMFWCDFKRKQS